MIALSWLEVWFIPAVSVALLIGFVIGVRVAMADHRYVLYWRRRAKASEGELRALRKKTPNVEVTGRRAGGPEA